MKYKSSHYKMLHIDSNKADWPKPSKQRAPRTKSNQRPEKEVEKEVVAWLKQNGFRCHVVESKGVYNAAAGRYLEGQTVSGFSDIVGACPDGRACFIELKAKGRRSTVSPNQKWFLRDKIEVGSFGCVTDSVEHLEEIYKRFSELILRGGVDAAKLFLENDIP